MTEQTIIHSSFLETLHSHLSHHKIPGWLVGGSVRDAVLQRPSLDVDVAVDGDASVFARALADATGGSWVPLDDERDTARVVWPDVERRTGRPSIADFARLRAPTIEDDLRDRDFTINALALAITSSSLHLDQLIDPLGGMEDMRHKRLRRCHGDVFVRDPARMLRAVRFAGQLGLTIDDELDQALRDQHDLLGRISPERICDELLKIFMLPDAGRWVRYLDDVQLLTTIIPELEPARHCDQPRLHAFPVLEHLIESVICADWLLLQIADAAGIGAPVASDVQPAALAQHPTLSARLPNAARLQAHFAERVDGVPRSAFFKLAVLLHDVAKPQTKAIKPDGGVSFYDHQTIGAEVALRIVQRLRLSRAASAYIRLVVREHMRPGQLSELGEALTTRAVYRFFSATGAFGPDVLIHSLCDHLGMKGAMLTQSGWHTHVHWTAQLLEAFSLEQTNPPESVVRGDDLMQLGIPQGPLVGKLLGEIREAQAVGEISTRDEALAWVRRRKNEAQ